MKKIIYELYRNTDYQYANSDNNLDITDEFTELTPKPITNWKRVSIYFEKYDVGKRLKIKPDYTKLVGIDVFSDKSIESLKEFFNQGELFEVGNFSSEKIYYFFNFLRSLDCLDKEKSIYRDNGFGSIIEIKKYELVYELIKNEDFFKIKGKAMHTYVSEKFVNKVLESKLRGFNFIPIWNSDGILTEEIFT